MSVSSSARAWMAKGLDGGNKGLDMGLPRLQKYVPGLQQGTYYLVGGEPGTGKSGFTDQSFIYHPYDALKQKLILQEGENYKTAMTTKLKIFKESLEIEARAMIVKAACWRAYTQHNVLTDINTVLSRGENRCPQELYDLVIAQMDYFEEMEDVVTLNDHSNSPTGINKRVRKWLVENGRETYKTVNNDNGKGDIQVFDKYESPDPERVVELLVDHVGLQRKEAGLVQKKDIIDKLSTDYCIPLRNNYGVSPVLVSQLNRTLSSADRAKIDRVRPQLSDFKDTGSTQEDANVIFALFSPNRYGIANYGPNNGYDITKLKHRFISLSLLKNRDGEADKMLGMKFLGECGYFEEMPTEEQMKERGAYDRVLRN